MPLTPTSTLVRRAAANRTGVGAFNVISLETAEGLASAAERAGLGVILQISQNCVSYHGGLGPIAAATLTVAAASAADVAVHLDHATSEALAREAIDLGFGSVMYDGAHLDYADNVAATRRVAAAAHSAGVLVEAELGTIGGKDGAHAPGVRTDPAEAASFATETGVDALAVAVGSSHAMTSRDASLDLSLITRIAEVVPVPLVLHGSSGVPDDQLVRAVSAGMTKINVSTHLNGFFTGAVRAALDADPALVDSRLYLSAGRAALSAEAERLLVLFAGQAAR